MTDQYRKVFISYARKDGRELAYKLQRDLQASGFGVWMDTNEIQGGANWSKEIEDAIEDCSIALALLSAGSYISEICRAEHLRCLRKGKLIIPILVQADAERPLYFEQLNYRDFTENGLYDNAYQQVLADIGNDKIETVSPKHLKTYTNAPALPLNFVERPEDLAQLRQELISDNSNRRIALTALQGMGGIGKSALAARVCRDDIVQAAFPDGVIWVDVGEDNVNKLNLIKLVGKELGVPMGHYTSDIEALSELRKTLPTKSTLIILDDVWNVEHARLFSDIESPCSRILFTTRDARIGDIIGASEVRLNILDLQQSLDLLKQWAERDLPEMPEIAEKLGYLPLALKIAGGRLREMSGKEWLETFSEISSLKAGRRAKTAQDNLHVCFDLSIQQLESEDQLLYRALGMFPEDIWIPEGVTFKLWQAYESELSISDCREIARDLHKLALMERREVDGSIQLHDLLHDYNRVHMQEHGELHKAHIKLLNAYNPNEKHSWWEIESDGYIYFFLCHHLIGAGRMDELFNLLTDSPSWMNAMFAAFNGHISYLADIDLAIDHIKSNDVAKNIDKLVRLYSAKQIITNRVNQMGDGSIEALTWLERKQEALNQARLRQVTEDRVKGLITIIKVLQEQGHDIKALATEIEQSIQAITDYRAQVDAICALTITLHRANHTTKARQLLAYAEQLSLKIPHETQRTQAISNLAVTLVEIGEFKDAKRVATADGNDFYHDNTLYTLATALVEIGEFKDAERITLAIRGDSRKMGSLVKARILIQQKKYQEAEQVLSSIQNFYSYKLIKELVKKLAQEGQYVEAERIVTNIQKPHPRAKAYSDLAEVLATFGQIDDAERLFIEAERDALAILDGGLFNEDRSFALCHLAKSLSNVGQYDEAKRVFDEAKRLVLSINSPGPKSQIMQDLVKELIAKELFIEATQIAKAIETHDRQLASLEEIVAALARSGKFDETQQTLQDIEYIRHSVEYNSDLIETLICISNKLRDSKSYISAQLVLNEAERITLTVKIDPKMLYSLVAAWVELEQIDAAIRVVDSIEYIGYRGNALTTMAATLAKMGHYRQSENTFKKARKLILSIESDLSRSSALRDLIIALANNKYYSEAEHLALGVDHWHTSKKDANKHSVVSYRDSTLQSLSIILAQSGEFHKAERVALSIAKNFARIDSLLKLVINLAEVEKYEEVERVYKKIIQNVSATQDKKITLQAICSIAITLNQLELNREAQQMLHEVEQQVLSIQNRFTKLLVLKSLVHALINIEEYHEVARIVQKPELIEFQIWGKSQLMIALAKSDNQVESERVYEDAKVLLQNLKGGRSHDEHISYFTDALIRIGNYIEAEQLAKRLTSNNRTRKNIALELAKREQYLPAERIAKTISGRLRLDTIDDLVKLYITNNHLLKAFNISIYGKLNSYVRFLTQIQLDSPELFADQTMDEYPDIVLEGLKVLAWLNPYWGKVVSLIDE